MTLVDVTDVRLIYGKLILLCKTGCILYFVRVQTMDLSVNFLEVSSKFFVFRVEFYLMRWSIIYSQYCC